MQTISREKQTSAMYNQQTNKQTVLKFTKFPTREKKKKKGLCVSVVTD